jgi:hypothetical protein
MRPIYRHGDRATRSCQRDRATFLRCPRPNSWHNGLELWAVGCGGAEYDGDRGDRRTQKSGSTSGINRDRSDESSHHHYLLCRLCQWNDRANGPERRPAVGRGIAGHGSDLFGRGGQPAVAARATMSESEYNAANRLGEVR